MMMATMTSWPLQRMPLKCRKENGFALVLPFRITRGPSGQRQGGSTFRQGTIDSSLQALRTGGESGEQPCHTQEADRQHARDPALVFLFWSTLRPKTVWGGKCLVWIKGWKKSGTEGSQKRTEEDCFLAHSEPPFSTVQVHLPTVGWALLQQLVIKKVPPLRHAHRPSWWRQLFNGGFLFPDVSNWPPRSASDTLLVTWALDVKTFNLDQPVTPFLWRELWMC